jgi:23S rRNA pseudouridine1911/1915/1917 synthase
VKAGAFFYHPLTMSELLQDRLRKMLPQAKQTTLREMLAAGRVRVNGLVVNRMKHLVQLTDQVDVVDRNAVDSGTQHSPSLHPLKLIFEDADVLVIDKPAGLLTSTVPREPRPTALAIVRRYVQQREPAARVGSIHRLDRDASGLLVFSKSDDAYRSLKQQFFKHGVERVYIAITHGAPTPFAGRIESRLVELPDGSVRSSRRPGAGELAISEFETVAREKGLAAVRVKLHTGRKHQIRVHLSERGVPIVGDRVYGKQSDKEPRLMLAAVVLGFVHPRTGQSMRFELSIPREFPLFCRTLDPRRKRVDDK